MTPADIDPSLRPEPLLETLDGGFSPPPEEDEPQQPETAKVPPEQALGTKSPF